jgi:threonylcarbamoyladenosine tRNA methylthiotransferase MtaB
VNVYFHTFGCKANQYDTALVRQAFADQGAVMVDDPAAADLAVVNSCTVTHESEAKLRRLVRRLARRGGRGRGRGRLETVVMGCAAARDAGAIAALPGVRAVVGGAEPVQVLRAAGLTAPPASPSGPLSTASPPGPLSTHVERGNAGQGSRARGLLKIQDGCDEHCTFCATTIARGANRSRSIPELVREAQALAEHHAEIVLTGIHIGTYGQDRSTDPGRKSGDETEAGTSGFDDPRAGARGQSTLGNLLEALISRVPQVRFRLSSIEATEVDDTIAGLLIEAPANLAAHLHAPLQSGANRILKRMGRHWYTAESYRARLEWLAARLPVFGLGADIIAGFPGERDAEHRQTVALVDALPFTYLHVFPYSERPGAAAARLGERVPAGTIRERARELRERGEANARAHRASRLGQRADGVVCGHGEGKVEVLTEDYLSVYLPTHEWNGRPRFEVTVR